MVSFSSAGLFDPNSELAFHKDGKTGEYGYYEINDTDFWFFNNKPVKTIELIENEYSVYTAWNIKEIEIFKPSKLFDKTNYLDREQDKYRINLLSSETHLYREWEAKTRLISNQSCINYSTSKNQTQICSEYQDNSYEEEYEEWSNWKLYNFQTVQEGLYQTKTIVTRTSQNTGVIDWVDENEGWDLDEWATWWDTDWQFKREISNLTGNLSALFSITWDSDMQADFDDLRFIDTATESIELNYTIESFINSISAVVRVNNIGASSVMMYYGNPSVSTTESANDTYFNPITGYYFDANPLDFIGTNNATLNGVTNASGYINESYDFDGTNDWVNPNFQVNANTNVYTFSSWINLDSLSTDSSLFSSDNTNPAPRGFQLQVLTNGAVNIFDGSSSFSSSAGVISTGNWYFISFVLNGTNSKVYLNSTSIINASASYGNTNKDLIIGQSSPARNNNYVNGRMDEILIHPYELSQEQHIALHNQTVPSFIEGPEQIQIGVFTTLIHPSNGQNILNNIVIFNFTSRPVETNLTNATLFIWFNNGTLVETNFTTLIGNESVNTTFINTLGDEVYKWNVETCGENVNCSFANINNSFTVHATLIAINISEPEGTIEFIKLGDNETLSWILSEPSENLTTHLSNCSYTYNSVITFLPLNTCLVINTTEFEYILGVNTINFNATDEFNLTSNKSTTWTYALIEINQTFMNETTEGATEEFIINFIKKSDVQISTINLIYNGTSNSFTYLVSGNNVTAQSDITIPVVSVDTNITFFWNITLDDGSSIITSSNNQTILSINVDNCSSFTNLIYNFTQYDEENQSILGGNNTIELQINLYDTRKTTLLANFSNSFTGVNPVQFCTENSILPTVNYSSYVIVKYFVNSSSSGQSYSVEYYNILNQTIGNTTIPIDIALFNLKEDDTTKFRLTFRDGEYVLSPNILVQVHRQYIKDNDFKIVEIPITDSNGQTILNLVKDNIVYNFIMVNEARKVVGTFNSIKAFCQDFVIGDCTINLAPDSLSEQAYDYNEEFDISISDPSYDNSTKRISISFVTGDLLPETVSMQVVRNNQFGNRSVCSDSLFSASGILSCDVSTITDTDQFLFISTFVNDSLAKQDPINLNSDILNFGTLNGAFYAFLLILFLITMFMEDRKSLVIALGLGWVVIISLGLMNGKLIGFSSAGIWILISIGIFLWKLNNEESP